MRRGGLTRATRAGSHLGMSRRQGTKLALPTCRPLAGQRDSGAPHCGHAGLVPHTNSAHVCGRSQVDRDGGARKGQRKAVVAQAAAGLHCWLQNLHGRATLDCERAVLAPCLSSMADGSMCHCHCSRCGLRCWLAGWRLRSHLPRAPELPGAGAHEPAVLQGAPKRGVVACRHCGNSCRGHHVRHPDPPAAVDAGERLLVAV